VATEIHSYEFRTAVGTVELRPKIGGRHIVIFDGEEFGSYYSARAAADDVAGGHTFTPSCGIDLGELGIPGDLVEWDKRLLASVARLRPS
jgi:hypothetical protein